MRFPIASALTALALVAGATAREPSHTFQGFYRGYLEQYAAADLPDEAHNSVAVIGYVKKPGVIPAEDGLTLTKALEKCGGFADWADHHHIGIWKDAEGRFLKANAHAIERKEEPDPVLQKGDIVVITVRWID